MSSNRAKNTKLEVLIRRRLHAKGFRYGLHARHLPGRPDLVLTRWRAVVFINGCFWHGHDCARFKLPRTNVEYWRSKIEGNRARDAVNRAELIRLGWRILTIWECAVRRASEDSIASVVDEIANWIRSESPSIEITEN